MEGENKQSEELYAESIMFRSPSPRHLPIPVFESDTAPLPEKNHSEGAGVRDDKDDRKYLYLNQLPKTNV